MKRTQRFIGGTVVLIIAIGLVLFRTCHQDVEPNPKVVMPQPQRNEIEPQEKQKKASNDFITQNTLPKSATDGIQLNCLTKTTSARKVVIEYSPEQIVGEWHQGTIHDIYYNDGTGRTWDESDDVTAEEGKIFKWSLEHNTLETYYSLATGGVVPRIAYVAKVDSEYLQLRDGFGNNYIYSRINNNHDVIQENESISQKK